MANPYDARPRGPKWGAAAGEDRTGLRHRLEGTGVATGGAELEDLRSIARDHREEVGAGETVVKLIVRRIRRGFTARRPKGAPGAA